MHRKKETANVWEYKVGNNANFVKISNVMHVSKTIANGMNEVSLQSIQPRFDVCMISEKLQ